MLRKGLGELATMVRTYRVRGYPPFVYAGGDTSKHLPIFFYHDIDAEAFGRDLDYLTGNGYVTLTCGEADDLLKSGREIGCKAVLTFDDGLENLYTTIFPAVQARGIKIVAYVVPDWIGQKGFVTWDQCREMHDSGLIDIQSHSRSHVRLVTDMTIVEVWDRAHTPGPRWQVPELRPVFLSSETRYYPVFPGCSLFNAAHAYRLPAEFWRACAELGKAQSGSLSAARRGFDSLLARYRAQALPESGDTLAARILEDLAESKAAIERELPGHEVAHFAFPWHVNSASAWPAVARARFRSAAVGLEEPGGGHDPGTVRKLLRVNGDFLRCLPGKSRKSFASVLAGKIARRLSLGR